MIRMAMEVVRGAPHLPSQELPSHVHTTPPWYRSLEGFVFAKLLSNPIHEQQKVVGEIIPKRFGI